MARDLLLFGEMPNGSEVLLADEGQHPVEAHQILSDKYELLGVMSSGGMGSIWAAHHLALGCKVAIKLLHEKTTCTELRERLVQEAQLAARIEHPNIVRVFDLGFTERNAPYLVMELLDGRDLGAELEECGRLPPVRAVQLMLPVLEGLAAAHDRNIVHRDLKPENIFLDRTEGGTCLVPKIVDFGIARCLTELGARRITSIGSVFGTVHYLSPEQALGRDDVDHRADIWGLCAVLYECITGQPPFGDREPASALRAIILEDVPPPSQLNIDAQGLEPLLMRGLNRDREQRWPDARSLSQALSRWLTEQGVHEDASAHKVRPRCFGSISGDDSVPPPSMTVPPPALRRRGAKWFALGSAALFLVSGVALAGTRQRVSELQRAGALQLVHVDRLAKEPPTVAAPVVQVQRAETPARPAARRASPARKTVVSKTKRFDPSLGF